MLIEKYSARWPQQFREIELALGPIVSGIIEGVEHVGSTAVPDLDAKPIIDIDLIYADEAAFSRLRLGLMQLSYTYHGNQGIVQREVFKRNGKVLHPTLDAIPHHLYACPASSPELARHLLFRDHLRKNETARMEYCAKKHELAREADQDKKKYAALKEIRLGAWINEIVESEGNIRYPRDSNFPTQSVHP